MVEGEVLEGGGGRLLVSEVVTMRVSSSVSEIEQFIRFLIRVACQGEVVGFEAVWRIQRSYVRARSRKADRLSVRIRGGADVGSSSARHGFQMRRDSKASAVGGGRGPREER